MARLNNRQIQIPNGFHFHIPEVPNWKPPRFATFDSIVRNAIALVNGNAELAGKYPTDYAAMADLVDSYNASICEQHGWTNYIAGATGGAPAAAPFYSPQGNQIPLHNKLKNVAEGSSTLVEWLASGAEAVSNDLANHRAGVCADCPMNGKGGIEAYFTVPVAEAIRKAVESRKHMSLSTFHDEKLGVCDACSCPLKLKVHFPIERLKVKLGDEAVMRMHPNCWIRKELA